MHLHTHTHTHGEREERETESPAVEHLLGRGWLLRILVIGLSGNYAHHHVCIHSSSHGVATLQAILNWVIAEYKKSRK